MKKDGSRPWWRRVDTIDVIADTIGEIFSTIIYIIRWWE